EGLSRGEEPGLDRAPGRERGEGGIGFHGHGDRSPSLRFYQALVARSQARSANALSGGGGFWTPVPPALRPAAGEVYRRRISRRRIAMLSLVRAVALPVICLLAFVACGARSSLPSGVGSGGAGGSTTSTTSTTSSAGTTTTSSSSTRSGIDIS